MVKKTGKKVAKKVVAKVAEPQGEPRYIVQTKVFDTMEGICTIKEERVHNI